MICTIHHLFQEGIVRPLHFAKYLKYDSVTERAVWLTYNELQLLTENTPDCRLLKRNRVAVNISTLVDRVFAILIFFFKSDLGEQGLKKKS